MKRFRGGLVFKAHRLSYHSTLGPRVEEEVEGTSSKAAASSLEALAALLRKTRAVALVRESNLSHPSLGITVLSQGATRHLFAFRYKIFALLDARPPTRLAL